MDVGCSLIAFCSHSGVEEDTGLMCRGGVVKSLTESKRDTRLHQACLGVIQSLLPASQCLREWLAFL